MTTFRDKLRSLGACNEALEWLGRRGPERAWRECPRGDWLLWLMFRVSAPSSPERLLAIRCACACARRALRFVPPGEDRPRLAIEAAERVGGGDLSPGAAEAAAGAAGAAWAAWAAWAALAAEAAWAARAAEHRACADAIRALCPGCPKIGTREAKGDK